MAQKNKDLQKTDMLIERLYKAYFTDSLDLSDHKTLVRIASDCGFNALEATEVLNSDLYANEVRKEEGEAYQLGVRGVPYYILDDKHIIPGALSEKEMTSAIQRLIETKV